MANYLSTRGGGDLERRVRAADELVIRTVVLLCKGRRGRPGRQRASP